MTLYLVDGNNYSHMRHGRVDAATDAEVIRTLADFALRRTYLRTETEIRLYLDSGARPELIVPLVTVRVAEPGTTADDLLIADLDYHLSKHVDCIVITADEEVQEEARERHVPFRHPADLIAEIVEVAGLYRQRTGRSAPEPPIIATSTRSGPPPAQASIGRVLHGKNHLNGQKAAGEGAPSEMRARTQSSRLPDDILARTRAFVRPAPTPAPEMASEKLSPPAPLEQTPLRIPLENHQQERGARSLLRHSEPVDLPPPMSPAPEPGPRFQLEWAAWTNAEVSRLLKPIDCAEHRSLFQSLHELLAEAPAEELVDLELLREFLEVLRNHCAQAPGFQTGNTAAERILGALVAGPEQGLTAAEIAQRTGLKEKDVRHKLLGSLGRRVKKV